MALCQVLVYCLICRFVPWTCVLASFRGEQGTSTASKLMVKGEWSNTLPCWWSPAITAFLSQRYRVSSHTSDILTSFSPPCPHLYHMKPISLHFRMPPFVCTPHFPSPRPSVLSISFQTSILLIFLIPSPLLPPQFPPSCTKTSHASHPDEVSLPLTLTLSLRLSFSSETNELNKQSSHAVCTSSPPTHAQPTAIWFPSDLATETTLTKPPLAEPSGRSLSLSYCTSLADFRVKHPFLHAARSRDFLTFRS